MTTFVDTSAFFALLAHDDERNDRAGRWLDQMSENGDVELVTHNYVVVESIALIHRRLGTSLARAFVERLLPVCAIRFVDDGLHERATVAYLAGLTRGSSFVDRVSFELMRMEGIDRAFAFDPDFEREGFATVP